MAQGNKDNSKSQVCELSDFLKDSHISIDVFAKISDDLKTRDIFNIVLISAEDNSVIELPTAFVLSDYRNVHTPVTVWQYEDWCKAEASKLSNNYDLRRFNRSTVISTLSRKVREHSQYSFIARANVSGEKNRVMKYSFVRLNPEGTCIMGMCQDITKSLEHDIITGGLNREGLLRELTQKLKNRPKEVQYSLLCFNIKNFRIINELHGNAIGDKVLQHTYTSIVYSELHPVSYARYEADNFICLIYRDSLDMDVVSRLCLQEFTTDSTKIAFRCLCGIFHISDDPVPAVEACAHAKLATTFIKDQFITPWIEFDKNMQQAAISDTEVLNRIDEAIEENEFVPYFQPVVNLQSGRIEMAEALVRWKSKKHGMVSPGVFIPVLERNGGLSRIDSLMEQSIFNLQKKRLSQNLPTVPIDLNLSWSDFADTKLISQLQSHILDPSVPTDLLRFEITESAYEEIAENRLDVLTFFQENDVKLLVDDFGQGYSFGTMKNVDFQIIKLDKSLIDKLGQSRKMDLLVKMLISVFHSMNTKVVAEGVEHKHQVDYLREAGCDFIQGFYFYRPMDEDAFLDLIDRQSDETVEKIRVDQPVSLQDVEAMAAPVLTDRDVLEEQNMKLRQLVEESKCLRMLLDEQDIHLFEWNVRTHEDIASEKFVKMYGLPSNIIPNMPEVAPLCVEEDRERFCQFYARAERGEKMGSDCFRLYTPDGKGYTWYRKTFYTIFDQKGLPYKAIITMQDCQDEYRYRMLRTRDRMLTQQQEITTFIYTLNDDRISITFRTHEGDVAVSSLYGFLHSDDAERTPDQVVIANELRRIIASGSRSGFFDFPFPLYNTEFRAHYSMVDGEYGHLYAIIGQAEDINKTRERLNAKEQLLRMAEIDGLTQIYNRATGERLVSELLSSHQPGVFGILDCDKFKSVNDTFGHVVGDNLLIAIANILKQGNPNGICMRLGGDEFAFFVKGNYVPSEVERDLRHLFDDIDQLQVEGMQDFPVTVSVGAVIYDGKEDLDFDHIYRGADVLLYKSKKSEGNKLTL